MGLFCTHAVLGMNPCERPTVQFTINCPTLFPQTQTMAHQFPALTSEQKKALRNCPTHCCQWEGDPGCRWVCRWSVGNITLQHPPDSLHLAKATWSYSLSSQRKKVYVPPGGGTKDSVSTDLVSCHSRRQISENQVNRLKSYIQAVSRPGTQ